MGDFSQGFAVGAAARANRRRLAMEEREAPTRLRMLEEVLQAQDLANQIQAERAKGAAGLADLERRRLQTEIESGMEETRDRRGQRIRREQTEPDPELERSTGESLLRFKKGEAESGLRLQGPTTRLRERELERAYEDVDPLRGLKALEMDVDLDVKRSEAARNRASALYDEARARAEAAAPGLANQIRGSTLATALRSSLDDDRAGALGRSIFRIAGVGPGRPTEGNINDSMKLAGFAEAFLNRIEHNQSVGTGIGGFEVGNAARAYLEGTELERFDAEGVLNDIAENLKAGDDPMLAAMKLLADPGASILPEGLAKGHGLGRGQQVNELLLDPDFLREVLSHARPYLNRPVDQRVEQSIGPPRAGSRDR